MNTRFTTICLLLLLIVGISACGKETATPQSSVTPVATAPTTTVPANETPSQATVKFFEAVRGRKYGDVRDMLSQRSINNLSESAKNINSNFDQALKRLIDEDANTIATAFETRNEAVHGDRATVEVKATTAPEFARLSMVKESGRWKINIDETTPAQ